MKKAQAAMEFLLSYGWAILVVLVVIGTLAYFGVLKPQNVLPEKCVISPGYSCESFGVREDGSAILIVKNGGADPIDKIEFFIGARRSDTCNGGKFLLPVGEKRTCVWNKGSLFISRNVGDKYTNVVSIKYTDRNNVQISKQGELAVIISKV